MLLIVLQNLSVDLAGRMLVGDSEKKYNTLSVFLQKLKSYFLYIALNKSVVSGAHTSHVKTQLF